MDEPRSVESLLGTLDGSRGLPDAR